jgi:hypothetical protein
MLDAPGTVKNLLTDNWIAANTDNKTPVIDLVYDVKELDISINDRILIYTVNETARINGIGSKKTRQDHRVSIDIRSAYKPNKDTTKAAMSTVTGHEHLLNIKEEVERIITTYSNNPGGNYQAMLPDGTNQNLSDKFKNLWRYVYEVKLIVTNK